MKDNGQSFAEFLSNQKYNESVNCRTFAESNQPRRTPFLEVIQAIGSVANFFFYVLIFQATALRQVITLYIGMETESHKRTSGDETAIIVSPTHSSLGSFQVENDQNKMQEGNSKSSFWHTTLNIIGGMMGQALMSLPFALVNGGWVGLFVLIVFGIIFGFAANLLTQCLDCKPRASNYQDIGEAAFSKRGRIITTALLYAEIFLILVAYTISLKESLDIIFPHAKFGNHVSGHNVVVLIAIALVLPTLWLRNMRSIAILSLVGILSTLLVISTVVWEAAFGGVGTSHHIPTFQIQHIPIASGIYIFCYGGSQVFPNIYRAMKYPNQFSKVVAVSFCTSTLVYIGFAFLGAAMFGREVNSLITLSMPRHTTAAKISLWTTVINPMSKYALQIVPVIDELESVFLGSVGSRTRGVVRGAISSVILIVVLVLAISLPYFGYVIALVGSLFSVVLSLILPCIFYIKICCPKTAVVVLNLSFIAIGMLFGIAGTIFSVKALIKSVKEAHG
eukprot:Gb_00873 [translate_table: standard]